MTYVIIIINSCTPALYNNYIQCAVYGTNMILIVVGSRKKQDLLLLIIQHIETVGGLTHLKPLMWVSWILLHIPLSLWERCQSFISATVYAMHLPTLLGLSCLWNFSQHFLSNKIRCKHVLSQDMYTIMGQVVLRGHSSTTLIIWSLLQGHRDYPPPTCWVETTCLGLWRKYIFVREKGELIDLGTHSSLTVLAWYDQGI